ncbi:ABC transporter permease [Candidatus Saccharibacteria bacterium TM7i]|nr:ABC transporter permease [Candidatus Saccharibacteria bacterium TM7i]
MLFLNHIENAIQSIRSNRLRSILTAIGVTIGIASITAILSLGVGARSIISKQVDELGGTIAVVRPGVPQNTITQNINHLSGSQYAASTLTKQDISSLKKIEHVTEAAPLMILQGAVRGDTTPSSNANIIATSPSLEKINQLKLLDGQFLDPDLIETTAVVGHQLAVDLFGTEQVIGKSVSVRGQSFTIIGVLQPTHAPINFNTVDLDSSVFIGFESGILQNQGTAHIQQINLQVDSVNNLESVVVAANKTLLKNHLNQADFSVMYGDSIAQPNSQLFGIITGVSVAIAAISLIVGGVGIMNIMLVSVAERTREIGIRKAMGATNSTILMQFITESLILSTIGGIVGYGLGYLLAFGVSLLLTFDPAFSWQVAIAALLVSVVTGTLFGAYPAIKAARKDPITALRLYN